MVKFFASNGYAFISQKQKHLSGKGIRFVLKWYGNLSLLENIESQPNIDNLSSYLSTLLLVLFFELKWWNFLVAITSLYLKKAKRFVTETIPFVLESYGKMSLPDI